jgi:PilZ domain
MSGIEPSISLSERRRSERQPYVVEAFIISPTARSETERREVTSINLSRDGIAFDFDVPLARKTYYRMEILLGGKQTVTEVRIVSCVPIEHGMYQIGAEFC